MLIIGIDPGITGAICFFEDGELKDVIDMPTMASVSYTHLTLPTKRIV